MPGGRRYERVTDEKRKRIVKLLEIREITLGAVANRTGVSKATVSKIRQETSGVKNQSGDEF